jgi:hypothetical protein
MSKDLMLLEACDAIPDITISKWACDPGGPWNGVREVLRARRAAQGLDVDAPDPETAFDEHGWLKARGASCEPARATCRRCLECIGQDHHWLTSMPECPEGGEPFIPCKHCPARAGVCVECGEGPVWPSTTHIQRCEICNAPGGV